MTLTISLKAHDTLVVTLLEGDQQTSLEVQPASGAARTLLQALDSAMAGGYGECFWPALQGGQYWWMFKREAEALEVIAMWTRGGASLWEHVFRATDSAAWVREQLQAELRGLGLP